MKARPTGETRPCPGCGTARPIVAYECRTGRKRRVSCRPCDAKRALAYYHANHAAERRRNDEYRRKNRERVLTRGRENARLYRAANVELIRAKDREYYRKNKERIKTYVKEWKRRNVDHELRYRLKKYRLAPDEYRAQLEQQCGVCAICRAEHGGARSQRLYVDHDHQAGMFRGLLCSKCNVGLGMFHDDVALLLAAAQYLREHLQPEPRERQAIREHVAEC